MPLHRDCLQMVLAVAASGSRRQRHPSRGHGHGPRVKVRSEREQTLLGRTDASHAQLRGGGQRQALLNAAQHIGHRTRQDAKRPRAALQAQDAPDAYGKAFQAGAAGSP